MERLHSIRTWLRSDMRTLRWVFLAIYLILIVSLFALGIYDEIWVLPIVALFILLIQATFIFGSGTIHLCRPIVKRRLMIPITITAAMFTLLATALCIALSELLYLDKLHLNEGAVMVGFWAFVLANWVGWGVVLYTHVKKLPRFEAMNRLTNRLLAGSLLELTATVPSHIIVSRRPGCLVGIGTMLGIVAGLNVMVFSFGPMIVLLFLRPRHRRERGEESPYCLHCGYDLRASKERCPECGEAFAAPATAAASLAT